MSVPTKELKFIHITKTAGSSIETVGLEKNKRWGINHSEYGFWHALFPNKPTKLKEKYDWFMVVRNPYKRILSEYHFLAGIFNYKHTKNEFNEFVKKWINNASNNIETDPVYGRKGGDHFTEQYKYLDPNIRIRILKFENIKEEFNNLMKEYNYNIVLNKKVQVSKNIFSLKDFNSEILELINKIYKKDFELFGYSMDINSYISSKSFDYIIRPLNTNNELVTITPEDRKAKELKFIHITKTAGTSIEEVGLRNKKLWGKYHNEYGYHHSIFSKKPSIFKEKYEWFMVVRDPYTRVVSEYHYLCTVNPKIINYSVEEFNNFIVKWATSASKGNNLDIKIGRGHFTEQYKYLDPAIKIHILKFENIEEEFNNLMKQYNYDITLVKHLNNSEKKYTVDDLTDETISIINTIYKNDFDLFNYKQKIVEIIKQIETPLIPISGKNKLKYIPITRNGNKYISEIATNLGLKWGENHGEYGWQFEIFLNKNRDLKNKYTWFMIVRDPYTRILSEYDFLNKGLYNNKIHTKEEFNSIITKWIQNVENKIENHPRFGRKIGDHFTEQYKYYDPEVKIHIVKYENLQEDMVLLLKEYEINHTIKTFNIETNFNFSIDDMSNDTIKLINRVYKKDFEQFNYTIQEIDIELQKQLKFIHITRTGGTSIEQIGLDNNKFWGRYDNSYGIFDESFTLKYDGLKRNFSWFTVVRNPYTRIISEYNYLKIVLRIKNSDDIKIFNSYIEKWLITIKNSGKVNGWHLIPQYTYIDSKYDITILKYENLTNEFNELMNKYKYDIKLNKVVSKINTKFTVKDLSPINIELIKVIYKEDFELFEYPVDYSI